MTLANEPERVSVTAAEQLDFVLGHVRRLDPVTVPLAEAFGLVLAHDVVSRVDIPRFDNSSMDGYAVRAGDVREGAVLPVVADIAAGSGGASAIEDGQVARIMTGAPIPAGADAVVPVEQTSPGMPGTGEGGPGFGVALPTADALPPGAPPPPGPPVVTFHVGAEAGQFVRRAAADLRQGDLVLRADTRLGSTQLAAAASAGHGELTVYPAPRVAIIATGSELVAPGAELGSGQIPDSNSTLLAACVREAGGVPVSAITIDDDEELLRELLDSLRGSVDAIVLSGGVSMGAYDIVKTVLSELGSVRFSAVRMQPGKPQAFGTISGGCPVFALPGNPVSVFVSFEAFVRPALRVMRGDGDTRRPHVAGVAASDWSSPQGRQQFMPVAVDNPGEAPLWVRPAARGGSGSHLVASLALADGLAIVPEHVTQVRAGDPLTVMLVT